MSSSLCKNLEGAIFPLQVEAVTSTKFSYVATNSEPSGHCTGINITLNGRIAKPEGFTIAGDFVHRSSVENPGVLIPLGRPEAGGRTGLLREKPWDSQPRLKTPLIPSDF